MASALALAVDEELSLVVVGVAHHRCHLAFASRPSPVGQQMDGVVAVVPYRAVEIVAVLGQSGEVADAEIAAARRPVGVVGRGLAEIIKARPDKLPDGVVLVVLSHEVALGQIAP